MIRWVSEWVLTCLAMTLPLLVATAVATALTSL